MSLDQQAHLLVPTNFGIASRFAQRTALSWASQGSARVTILHVSTPAHAEPTGFDALRRLHGSGQASLSEPGRREKLKEFGRSLHPELDGYIRLQTAWREGDVVREIKRFVVEEAVDTVIIGAAHWRLPWQSSLGTKLARQLPCRVVVVHEPAPPLSSLLSLIGRRRPRPSPALTPMMAAGSQETT